MPCDEWRGAWVTERWTRERIDILARDWPTERCPEAILADVNALEGPPVELSEMGGLAGAKMKLTRPPGCKERWKDERRRRRAGLASSAVDAPQTKRPITCLIGDAGSICVNDTPIQAEDGSYNFKGVASAAVVVPDPFQDPPYLEIAVPQPEPAPEQPAEPPPPASMPPVPVPEREPRISAHLAKRWTPERVAILKQDWPTYRLSEDILAEINDKEGPEIDGHDMALVASERLGLKRPEDYRSHSIMVRRQRAAEQNKGQDKPQPKSRMGALMQVSRSIGTPASPPTKKGIPTTRDGSISFAALQEKAEGQPSAAVVSWKTAMDWAAENKVRLGGTEDEDLAAANAERAKWHLPQFVVRGH